MLRRCRSAAASHDAPHDLPNFLTTFSSACRLDFPASPVEDTTTRRLRFSPASEFLPAMTYTQTLRTAAFVLTVVAFPAGVRAADPTGAELYTQHCKWCHGASGEGAKRYKMPLVGDKSVSQLAKLIDDTMPEDDPDKLDAAESARVAAYIYSAFYSPTAQARNAPARVELARLTVGQYRNAVADIVGGFRPAPKWGDARRAARRILRRPPVPPRQAGDRPHRPRGAVRLRHRCPRQGPVRRERVRDPLVRVGDRPGDRGLRVRRPHRTRDEAVRQRHRAADRRLGEVRDRPPSTASRRTCSAAGRTRSCSSSRRPLKG